MDLRNILLASCPVPYSFNNKSVVSDGVLIKIPDTCKTICNYKCIKSMSNYEVNKVYYCHKNFNYQHIQISDDMSVFVFGFVSDIQIKLSRKKKKDIIPYIISLYTLDNWVQSAKSVVRDSVKFISNKIQEALNPLHDIKTAISLIYRNTEELIAIEPGDTFDEKINNSDPKKKALFKSVGLLEERIKLMDIVSNPSAASHGQKRRTPVYKVVEKLAKIHYAVANPKRLRIHLKGSSFNTPDLYDSFSTIPLVLIDNAIKYSRDEQDITISISDLPFNGVRVLIESFSPKIDADIGKKFFKMNIRGEDAYFITRKGSGVGLYLAKIVAEANNLNIFYYNSGYLVNIGGIEYANNIFGFESIIKM